MVRPIEASPGDEDSGRFFATTPSKSRGTSLTSASDGGGEGGQWRTSELPGLRPIETPLGGGHQDGGGSPFFSTPSPLQSCIDGVTSDGCGSSSSDCGLWISTDEVLPQHYGHGVDGGTTVLRRIRTTLSSPFRSPLVSRNGSKTKHKGSNIYDEDIFHRPAWTPSPSKRRRFNGHWRSGGKVGTLCAWAASLAVALILGLCVYSYSTEGGAFALLFAPSSSSPTTIGDGGANNFAFRPPPARHSPSYDAVERFRSSYGTIDRSVEDDDGRAIMIGIDDPLNPGSIFVVLDVRRPAVEGDEEGDEYDDNNNFINRDGALFGQAREFAMGFEAFLLAELKSPMEQGMDVTGARKLVEATSFYSLLEENLPHVAGNKYATDDGLTTLIEVGFAVPSSRSNGVDERQQQQQHQVLVDYDYVQSVIEAVKEYVRKFARFDVTVDVGFTGLPLLRTDLLATAGRKSNQLSASDVTASTFTSLEEMLPSTAPSLVSYRRITDRFGRGILSPYKIVFDRIDTGHFMDTRPGFDAVHLVMRAFAEVDINVATVEEELEEELETADGGVFAVNLDSIPQRIEEGNIDEHLAEIMDEVYGPAKDGIRHGGHLVPSGRSSPPTRTVYNGIAVLRNTEVPYPLYVVAKICRDKQGGHGCTKGELLQYLTTMMDVVVSPDTSSTYVSATLGVDPYSEDGIAWLVAARAKLRELENGGDLDGFRVTIIGGATLEYDALQMAEVEREASIAGDKPLLSPSQSLPLVLAASAVLLLLVIGVVVRPFMAKRGKSKAYDYKRV